MQRVLVLGAGLIARPLVRYLLDRGFAVHVASRTKAKAEALVFGHPQGSAEGLDVADGAGLERRVKECDLAVSLLPYAHHPDVARLCVRHRKQMVTTSYVSDAMRALDAQARAAGVLILNEIGVDPGLDHMSAMRVMDDVKARGGKVVLFKSSCGGLPAPEANDNPFGYKFSWSPKGVLLAGRNDGKYLEDGEVIAVPNEKLFRATWPVRFDGVGDFVIYTNRNCLGYKDLYGLAGVRTLFRGTIRYPGWCETLDAIRALGMLEDAPRTDWGGSARDYLSRFLPGGPHPDLRKAAAERAGIPPGGPVVGRLEWLGLFDDRPRALAGKSSLDILAEIMLERMTYKKGERDMILMVHEFLAEHEDGRREKITSTLVDFGIPGGDTSMARTVSLPAAIAVRMILEGRLPLAGVRIAVLPEIYRPVLAELEQMGIRFVERTQVLSENG